jgi:hypothetical protein
MDYARHVLRRKCSIMAIVSLPYQTASIKFLPAYARSVLLATFFWTIRACWQALVARAAEVKSFKSIHDQEWTTDISCWTTI